MPRQGSPYTRLPDRVRARLSAAITRLGDRWANLGQQPLSSRVARDDLRRLADGLVERQFPYLVDWNLLANWSAAQGQPLLPYVEWATARAGLYLDLKQQFGERADRLWDLATSEADQQARAQAGLPTEEER